jgi:hypothetical protein
MSGFQSAQANMISGHPLAVNYQGGRMVSLSKRIVTGNDEHGRSRAVVNDSPSKRGLTAEIWRTRAEAASAWSDNVPHGSMARSNHLRAAVFSASSKSDPSRMSCILARRSASKCTPTISKRWKRPIVARMQAVTRACIAPPRSTTSWCLTDASGCVARASWHLINQGEGLHGRLQRF